MATFALTGQALPVCSVRSEALLRAGHSAMLPAYNVAGNVVAPRDTLGGGPHHPKASPHGTKPL